MYAHIYVQYKLINLLDIWNIVSQLYVNKN